MCQDHFSLDFFNMEYISKRWIMWIHTSVLKILVHIAKLTSQNVKSIYSYTTNVSDYTFASILENSEYLSTFYDFVGSPVFCLILFLVSYTCFEMWIRQFYIFFFFPFFFCCLLFYIDFVREMFYIRKIMWKCIMFLYMVFML